MSLGTGVAISFLAEKSIRLTLMVDTDLSYWVSRLALSFRVLNLKLLQKKLNVLVVRLFLHPRKPILFNQNIISTYKN